LDHDFFFPNLTRSDYTVHPAAVSLGPAGLAANAEKPIGLIKCYVSTSIRSLEAFASEFPQSLRESLTLCLKTRLQRKP